MNPKAKPAAERSITPAMVAELFAYDPETGAITKRATGEPARSINSARGRIKIGRHVIAASAIAHALHTGAWPECLTGVVYKNGNKLDYRWSNMQFRTWRSVDRPSKTQTGSSMVLNFLRRNSYRGFSRAEVEAAIGPRVVANVASVLKHLRQDGLIHICGVDSKRYGESGHITYIVKFGPPPAGFSEDDIKMDVDVVRQAALSSATDAARSVERAEARAAFARSYTIKVSIYTQPAERIDETITDEVVDGWIAESKARASAAVDELLQGLRKTGAAMSIFNVAANGSFLAARS